MSDLNTAIRKLYNVMHGDGDYFKDEVIDILWALLARIEELERKCDS
jgi:hypothetical protein